MSSELNSVRKAVVDTSVMQMQMLAQQVDDLKSELEERRLEIRALELERDRLTVELSGAREHAKRCDGEKNTAVAHRVAYETLFAEIQAMAHRFDPPVKPVLVVAGGGAEVDQKWSEVNKNWRHVLYKTGDADAPDSIKDRNGEVVLDLCRVCGQAENQLDSSCPGRQLATAELVVSRTAARHPDLNKMAEDLREHARLAEESGQ